MIAMKLIQLTSQTRGGISLKRFVASPAFNYNGDRFMSKKTQTDEFDQPIKYSTSKAASWKAEYARQPHRDSVAPSWDRPVIALSLAIFLIYFCILREENDIDRLFDRDLFVALKEDEKWAKKT